MLNKNRREKVLKIMDLAMIINSKSKNTVTINYYGAFESFDIKIYEKGYKNKSDDDYSMDMDLKKDDDLVLDSVIDLLTSLANK